MQYLELVIDIYMLMLIFTVLLTWIPKAKDTKVNKLLQKTTNPYFSLFEGIPHIGMLNIQPLIALIVYQIATQTILDIIYTLI